MKRVLVFLALTATALLHSQVPDNLVVEGVPPIPEELRSRVRPYLEFRLASFQSWHPQRMEMLITTRFADTPQIHSVAKPGGARRQLTFFNEPVAEASYQPRSGQYLVFSQDMGGGEFFQLYRFDPTNAQTTLLTDGKSRNMGAVWANSGSQLAYTSTRRNGKDNDLYVIDPLRPDSNRLVAEVHGGGWSVSDWSPDDLSLLVANYESINQSHLFLLNLKDGQMKSLTPPGQTGVAWGSAQFSRDGKTVYATSDQGSEFRRVVRMELATGAVTVLIPDLKWDVETLKLSPDGKTLAYVANENGASVLHLWDVESSRERPVPPLPLAVLTGLEWHSNGTVLGFSLSSAQSPADAWSLDVSNGRLTRWTESETGGLDAAQFRVPELIRTDSFDGLPISGFLYRPDPARFPGPRPVLILIHGGPESQSRPVFLGRNNFLIDQLGIALLYPNVRGSSGYGKTFLTLDNGRLREDSVKDIGTFLNWLERYPLLDRKRVAVMGGSYGGYMTLASLVHFGSQLRAGIDIVGISSFVTFLENTQDYRRDLRRVEYGDERDPEMRAILNRISPLNQVSRIRTPLLVVQGLNDPRVPVTEAEQMVKAIRGQGGTAWYLMAKDEGHGFAKKKNADFQFLSTLLFLEENLLE